MGDRRDGGSVIMRMVDSLLRDKDDLLSRVRELRTEVQRRDELLKAASSIITHAMNATWDPSECGATKWRRCVREWRDNYDILEGGQ